MSADANSFTIVALKWAKNGGKANAEVLMKEGVRVGVVSQWEYGRFLRESARIEPALNGKEGK